jgi:hypothetical protein
MSGATTDRGKKTEAEVASYLKAWGWPVRLVAQDGRRDRGDLEGMPDTALQIKDHERFDLAGWCDDVEAQRITAAERYGVVIARRRNEPLSKAYAILTLEAYAKLMYERDVAAGLHSPA